ncbi:MAG: tetratricopeptide repeat protein [Gammaproteobacteria bacterium]|nr:tetratricopeptide repeat protein [Gammaproteobacteria bacterium]
MGFAANADVEALIMQGSEYARTGDVDAAYESYKQALALDPQSADVRLKVAGMQIVRGDYRDSIESFQNVIGSQPGNANAFAGMGIAYLHLGDYGLARASFEEALKHDEGKKEDIQQMLDWLDAKMMSSAGEH